MANRWNNIVKDYFSFTKKERTGIFIICLVIVAVFLAARLWPLSKSKPVAKDAFQKELAQLNITIDSSQKNNFNYKNYSNDYADDYTRPKYDNESNSTIKGELFTFDPNTLDENGWRRLGIREKTIQTIQKLVSKGFKFRQPEDIKKIFGLRPEDAERLVPYVQIANQNNSTVTTTGSSQPTYSNTYSSSSSKAASNSVIEVNSADSTQLISLPGIGSKLASRIITFREKLGGFTSVNQVGETYGIPDSTFQKIKPRLQVNSSAVKKLSINTPDINQLKSHPYIRWNIANAIINYKQQHGEYKTLADLKKIDIITEEVFAKIAPYLSL